MPGSNKTIGRLVRLSRQREKRDHKTGRKRGLRFDKKAADRAVNFFRFLRHSKGEWAGRPFNLAHWQEHDVIRPLFGWRRADGTRRFRNAYISVARKNGKSTLAAGIGLYLTVADSEPGAEVYSAATKRDQARIVHGEAVRMVRSSPDLKKRIRLYRDSISRLQTGSKYEPLGADANTCDGLNIHGAIVDEIHAHKTRAMWDILETGTGARRQPLQIAITTAGSDRQTICWELHDRAVRILEGSLEDDSFFAYIAQIDEGDDWKDVKCWPKANPNLGISVKMDGLLEQAERAKDSPAFQNTFRRLRLNQWTEQAERFIDMDAWLACGGSVDPVALRGKRCYGGLDLASTRDLTALALDFPIGEDKDRHKTLVWFWLPREGMAKRVKVDGVPYDVWVEKGLIKLTEGNSLDYAVVREDIKRIRDQYEIEELAYDPWRAAELATNLQDEGLKMVEFRQGFKSMSEPTAAIAALVTDGRLEHGSNPVLNWMAGNLAVKQDPAGNLKPDKEKSTTRIDGMVALIMAHGRAMLRGDQTSAYEEHGIRVF